MTLKIKAQNLLVCCIAIALITGFFFFSSLGANDLSEREAREALAVSEMVKHGDYFIPKINGDTPRTKPPLFHWAAFLFSQWRGVLDETSVRLPSAVSATAGVFATFLFTAFLFNIRTGFLASMVLTTSIKYLELANRARVDMTLCLFIALAFFLFYLGYRKGRGAWYFSLSFCAMGLAVLTKGPIGVLFPLLATLSFLAIRKRMEFLREIHLFKGLFIVLAFLTLWLLPALCLGGWELMDTAYQETLARFMGTTTHQAHIQPFYYYLPQILGGFAPWSLFLPAALFFHFKKAGDNEALLYILLWFFTIFLFLSLSAGKRGDYLLPLYPAAAILVGKLWSDFMDPENQKALQGFFFVSSVPILATGVILCMAALMFWVRESSLAALILPFLTKEDGAAFVFFIEKFDTWIRFFPLLFLSLGSLCVAQFISMKKQRTLVSFSLLSIFCLLLAAGVRLVMPKANEILSLKPFAKEIRERVPADSPLFFYDKIRLKMIFYAERHIPLLLPKSQEDFFKKEGPVYLIVPMRALEKVRTKTRSPVFVIASFQNFRDGYALLSNTKD